MTNYTVLKLHFIYCSDPGDVSLISEKSEVMNDGSGRRKSTASGDFLAKKSFLLECYWLKV